MLKMLLCYRWSYLFKVITCVILVWWISELVLLKLFYKPTFRMKTIQSVFTNVRTHIIRKDTVFLNSDVQSILLNVTHTEQRQTNSPVITRMLENEKQFIKSGDQRVYLYSAVGLSNLNITTKHNNFDYSSIVLTGWEHKSINKEEFICCYLLNNSIVLSIVSKAKRHWIYSIELQAKQYTCPAITNNIKGISVSMNGQNCSHSKSDYLKPSYPRQQYNTSTIALCSKLAYGNLTATRLLEWFEAQKLFGVTKVLAYIAVDLNVEARKVFDYYISIGMAEVLEFGLPEKESVKRHIGQKNMQFWNDEQIVTFDCQIRLHGYKYVGVIDTDEFMVPVTNTFNNSWITYLDATFQNKSNIAGITFNVQVHATTWGPVNKFSKLFIGRYLNSTYPIYDRVKSIYMPSRVQIGSVFAHDFYASKGYTKYTALNEEAVLHHYRACRNEWLTNTSIAEGMKENSRLNRIYSFKFHQKCYDFRRHTSAIMQSIANILEPRVVKLCKQLNIQLSP